MVNGLTLLRLNLLDVTTNNRRIYCKIAMGSAKDVDAAEKLLKRRLSRSVKLLLKKD